MKVVRAEGKNAQIFNLKVYYDQLIANLLKIATEIVRLLKMHENGFFFEHIYMSSFLKRIEFFRNR